MRAFDPDRLSVVGPEMILIDGGVDITKKPVWIEAPHLFKVNGSYLLIAAEGGTAENHSEVALRSGKIEGPYTPYAKNPILTQRDLDPARKDPITSAGHVDLVQTPGGKWFGVFLGCRPYAPAHENHYNTGRETFLAPLRWDGPWPVITSGGESIPYSLPAPDLSGTGPGIAYGGRIVVRDEFDGPELDRGWMFLRTPHDRWYDLRSVPGSLSLRLRPESCSGLMNPSFLGRRQQHLYGSASTAVRLRPKAEHEKAGLLVFQNETHYYFLALSVVKGKMTVQLLRSAPGGGEKVLASRRLAAGSEGCRLKIEARGNTYAFFFGAEGEGWKPVAENIDATFLSTRTAGGFVGSIYALYATSNGRRSAQSAAFDWFEYTGDDEAHREGDT
jgi:alpha-N-arabinofuranosidase